MFSKVSVSIIHTLSKVPPFEYDQLTTLKLYLFASLYISFTIESSSIIFSILSLTKITFPKLLLLCVIFIFNFLLIKSQLY